MHPQCFKRAMVSMMFTPINPDYTKNKKSESQSNPDQESATHLGDTVDYYLIWKSEGGIGYDASGFDISFY